MVGFGQSQGRAERLVLLASALSLGTARSLDDLRDRFGFYADDTVEAMRRKFLRDKDDLGDAGVHVETIMFGEEARYWIRRRTAPLNLSAEEREVLAVLGSAISDPTTGAALATLAAGTAKAPDGPGPGRVAIGSLAVPAEVTDALVQGRRVTADYRDATGVVSPRTFEPWQLVHRKGLVYVVSWDVEREDRRNFRLDRFEGGFTDIGSAHVERPVEVLGPVHPMELVEIVADAPRSGTDDAVDMGASIRRVDDERFVVTFAGHRAEPVIAWALRHGASVVSPAFVAEDHRRRLTLLRDRHTGPGPDVARPPTPKTRAQTLSVERMRRLLVLPRYLANMGPVTEGELAAAMGCTVAELRVELELLDFLELPGHGNVGEVNEVDGKLVYVRQALDLDVELSTSDALQLMVLLEALGPFLDDEHGAVASLKAKLGVIVPASVSVWSAGQSHPDLEVLRSAIKDRDVVRFEYQGRKDPSRRVRQITPDQFRVAHGALYVAGIDVVSGEERQFRLDRMGPIEVTGDVPLMAAESGPAAYVPTEPEVEVLLVFNSASSWLLTHLSPVVVVQLDEVESVAVVKTDAVDWFIAHVMAAGGQAQVVSPLEVRTEIAARAAAALAR